MEFKGTKGKWYTHISPQNNKAYIGANDKYYVAEIIGNGREMEEIEANAKLIAAAPILLEACETALVDTEMLLSGECDFSEDNLLATIDNLKQAINKAIK